MCSFTFLTLLKFHFQATTAETHQSIEYLIKLNENATNLCDKYFEMQVFLLFTSSSFN